MKVVLCHASDQPNGLRVEKIAPCDDRIASQLAMVGNSQRLRRTFG
jgi:hypothetical protein